MRRERPMAAARPCIHQTGGQYPLELSGLRLRPPHCGRKLAAWIKDTAKRFVMRTYVVTLHCRAARRHHLQALSR